MQRVEELEEKVQPFLKEFARQQVTIRDICQRMGYIGQSSDPVNVKFQKALDLLRKGYTLLDAFRSAGIRFVQELQSANQSLFSGSLQEKNSLLCDQVSGKMVAVFQSWDGIIRLMTEDPRVRRLNELQAGKVEKHHAEKVHIDMAAVWREAATFALDLAEQSLDFKVLAFGVLRIIILIKRTGISDETAEIFREILEDLHDAELLTHAQANLEELIPLETIVRR